MGFWRRDQSVERDTYSSATEYYSSVRRGLREKADHNKFESQASFYAIIFLTLASPLFVTLGSGFFWGKLVPATLSVGAAMATAWVQLRKPQRLWAIYRRAQRELEREKAAFDFSLDAYAEGVEADRLLAARVSEIAFRVHEQWEGLVPEPDAVLSKTPAISMRERDVADGS